MGLDCRPKLGRNEAMICRLGMSYNPCHEQDNQNVDRFGDGSVFRLCDLFFDGSRSIPLRGLHGVSRTNGLCHGCGDHPPGGTTHGWRHSLRVNSVRECPDSGRLHHDRNGDYVAFDNVAKAAEDLFFRRTQTTTALSRHHRPELDSSL